MTSINLSFYITGSITKCHNVSLGLKLVYLWILTIFLSFVMFSLKFMNMQIRYLALLTNDKIAMSQF